MSDSFGGGWLLSDAQPPVPLASLPLGWRPCHLIDFKNKKKDNMSLLALERESMLPWLPGGEERP
jgi:hypothetical protein